MTTNTSFTSLGLRSEVLTALSQLGYVTPSPVQAQSIPILLNQEDLLAQAQTGTGKTAAFALPVLTRLSIENQRPQVLVLAPTRELAIQVAEAFKSYAKHLPGFRVLPIYGGQDYRVQLKALKQGVHVVVGTPGRVMDHLRRGTLKLDELQMVILDEADEMLKMGFIDDVKWILQQAPEQRQVALFSATMPPAIEQVAKQYMRNPSEVRIKAKTKTVEAIQQHHAMVSRQQKLAVLSHYLELEDFDGVMIFTRTKAASGELADKLQARGYSVAAINGDMKQSQREQVIARLKRGSLDIVVATEVAARGLDVDRISHVINYDIPYDAESYIHRVGRTGRAGREGKALLFLSPRERYALRDIERVLKHPIPALQLPSAKQVAKKRVADFVAKIEATLAQENLDYYRNIVQDMLNAEEHSATDIAAALVYLAQQGKPLQVKQEINDALITDQQSATPPTRGKRRKASSSGDFKRRKPQQRSGAAPRKRQQRQRRKAVA
jgi:ATP-dependent RNA helicase DeaD